MRDIIRGLIAGAAGTSALNAATYMDMAIRGRPASNTPEESVQRLADTARVDLGAAIPITWPPSQLPARRLAAR